VTDTTDHDRDRDTLHDLLGSRPGGSLQRIGVHFSMAAAPRSSSAANVIALIDKLEERGFDVVVDVESSGDGVLGVAAFRLDPVDEQHLGLVLGDARTLARATNTRYDGWTWQTTVAERRGTR